MPVGKNSIKRVTNNGYSKVTSKAPDMENSTVIANPSPEVAKVMIPSSEKIASKKKAAKKNTAPTVKKSAAKKEAPKTEQAGERSGSGYVNLGGELPIYLL